MPDDLKRIRLLHVPGDDIPGVLEELKKYSFESYKIGSDGVYVYYMASEEVDLLRHIAGRVDAKQIEDLGDVTLLQLDKIRDRLSNIFRRIR